MPDNINKYIQDLNRRWGEDPAGKLCVKLIEFMQKQPTHELEMLTFANIGSILERDPLDEHVIRAITILVSSSLHVLERHHIFIDEQEQEHEISKTEFKQIYKTGEYAHPVTGELIENWKEKVVPYFTPSQTFLKAKVK